MVYVFELGKLREAFDAYCAAQGIDVERRDLEFTRLTHFLQSDQARAHKLWMQAPEEKRT